MLLAAMDKTSSDLPFKLMCLYVVVDKVFFQESQEKPKSFYMMISKQSIVIGNENMAILLVS